MLRLLATSGADSPRRAKADSASSGGLLRSRVEGTFVEVRLSFDHSDLSGRRQAMVPALNLNVRFAQAVPDAVNARVRCSNLAACKPTVVDPAVHAPASFGRRPLLPANAQRQAAQLVYS